MRRAARTDANHAAIVDALRKAGAHVTSLAAIGDGCPDLLVGYRQRLYVLEVKDGTKPPSARELTADQVQWHAAALRVGVTPHVVDNLTDALRAIGAIT
jgi:Holliday junction resolvase